jgi:hypothetical protein
MSDAHLRKAQNRGRFFGKGRGKSSRLNLVLSLGVGVFFTAVASAAPLDSLKAEADSGENKDISLKSRTEHPVSDPRIAGAMPLTGKVDLWPGYRPIRNPGRDFDLDAIGPNPVTTKDEFVFIGQSNEGGCGPAKAIVSESGIVHPRTDAFLDDSGNAFLSSAAAANYDEGQGFGWQTTVDGDSDTGNFVVGMSFFNDVINHSFPNLPAALGYIANGTPVYQHDHAVFQRFTRNGTPMSPMTPGRNIPSLGSHASYPWFPFDGHQSRLGGAAILSNGNSLYYIADRSRQGNGPGDKGAVEYFADNSLVPLLTNGTDHRCNVFSIAQIAGAFVKNTTPAFVAPSTGSTFSESTAQGAAAGNGFFALRANHGNGTLAMFRNDGSRIAQVFGYADLYEANDSLTLNPDDLIQAKEAGFAVGGYRTYVGALFKAHGVGPSRPCVLVFQMHPSLTGGYVLKMLTPDDDYATPATQDVDNHSMDINANSDGDLVVCWRRGVLEPTAGDAPVARVYNSDGTPKTGSFLVSSTTDRASSYGPSAQADVKCAINKEVCIGWLTETEAASVNDPDCGGQVPMTISLVYRVFDVGIDHSTPTPSPSPTPTPTGAWVAPSDLPPEVVVLPDIRDSVYPPGNQENLLNLQEYLVDGDRVASSGALLPGQWGEDGVNTQVSPPSTAQVTIPTGAAPSDANVTFDVTDSAGSTDLAPVRVHTSDFLLGGPLVDTQLATGSGSGIPYFWAIGSDPDGAGPLQGSDPILIPLPQSTAGAGRLMVSITTGIGQSRLLGASSLLMDAISQSNPLLPYMDPVTLVGAEPGLPGLAPVSLNPGIGLEVQADVSGLTIIPDAGFSDWVRVSVTRNFTDGSNDSYSIAVANLLSGVNGNLQGNALGAATISTVQENYGFENLSLTDFLGTGSSALFNSGTNTARRNAMLAQQTSWQVIAAAMNTGNGALPPGVTLPDLDITATGKPDATYPGATSGNALKITFTGPNQRLLLTHKGIPRSQYSPGDVITLSLNTYVDLGYDGGHDDLINEPTSAFSYIFGLATVPSGLAQNLNVINFAADSTAFAPLRKGAAGGVNFGRGGGQIVNPLAVIDSKWTRQELTLRVPELGQYVQGPNAVGNTIDSLGLTAVIYLGRLDTPAATPHQTVWMDNISISNCPGALALAQGAINVPMISSGFCGQFNNGVDAGPGAFFVSIYGGDSTLLPAALARGETIYGSFSQGSDGTVNAADPIVTFGNGALFGHDQALNNARAGWLEASPISPGEVADLATIGTGAVSVALGFPNMPAGNRALLLGPAPATVTGNPYNSNLHPAGATRLGRIEVATPWLDMRLASDAVLPHLHVADAFFPGTGGNASGENGNLNPNQILKNVSGVFGVRWFTTSKAPSVIDNGRIDVTLLNADVNLGLIASCPSVILPSADNRTVGNAPLPPTVWVDDFISGTVITFNSYGKYYDLVLNSQPGGRAGMQSAGTTALANALLLENPGAQLADIHLSRNSDSGTGQSIKSIVNNVNTHGFENIYAPGPEGPITNDDVLPGRYSTAVLAIDEVNLYAVRDLPEFYDEDLQRSDLLP